LADCYFAFPEKAPNWWKPRRNKEQYEANLKKDEIRDEIAKLKNKRVRADNQEEE
jgi:hypothetical protein